MSLDEPRSRTQDLSTDLQAMVDEWQIRRLHAWYVDAVNRAAWHELAELFRPDAELTVSRGTGEPDRVVGPVAIGELIGGYVSKYDFLVQVILNARVSVHEGGGPDAAVARLYITEYRQWTGAGRWFESAGVYHDRYVRVDGRWWFAQRRYDRLYATARSDVEVHPFPEDVPFAGSLRPRKP
ncbi:MAG TPA: nuclear transport factor 2 family protein [Acidimicrobiales bacterium]